LRKILFFLLFLLITAECNGEEYRIISLAPNTTEILFALGLERSIVGVDEYSNYPEEARKITHVGTFDRPNIERIILLRPDYILVGTDMEKDKRDYLENLGVETLRISPNSVEELCDNIEMLGALFHKEAQAGLIVRGIKRKIREVSRNIKGDRPKVFVQLFNDPLVTVSSFISEVIRISGGNNIAWDVKGDAALFSYEVLLERNPDVIIVVGFSEEWDLPESINAVRKNRIFKDLDPDILLRPGPRVIEAIEELNGIFYEED
jgi:iron complex transport system substrate-binding protein